jgi:hypothetical protein
VHELRNSESSSAICRMFFTEGMPIFSLHRLRMRSISSVVERLKGRWGRPPARPDEEPGARIQKLGGGWHQGRNRPRPRRACGESPQIWKYPNRDRRHERPDQPIQSRTITTRSWFLALTSSGEQPQDDCRPDPQRRRRSNPHYTQALGLDPRG